MIDIRVFEAADWPEIWAILEPIFRAGETYAVARNISEDAAGAFWIDTSEETFVATDGSGAIVGSYYLKPNQAGPGGHVCNCGYAVAETARGQGIAAALCLHSQEQAQARGYRAMQFNVVASTNTGAVRLWQRHGFAIIGTLPDAFRHPSLGFVDAFVMYRKLAG